MLHNTASVLSNVYGVFLNMWFPDGSLLCKVEVMYYVMPLNSPYVRPYKTPDIALFTAYECIIKAQSSYSTNITNF